ncbi:type VI secretion system protein TssA [Rugamonas sp. DEMB1]|uniref:type VI secretion system protein TssA n=1 Tax=Rugamonas sp. DEMB1 TaxID=3039386 RepID=UPI00244C2575|nr:type VI secretion system protein TssA [Rugamonas sp. DEMB1]WGG48112.1 type VI secretion system protein TssA [Rugamonas sp. DEMB1]
MDLRIVAWLAEAWLRQRGLECLVDGARLLQASLEQYWDGLYPLAEDGDLDARLAALEWFDRHMAQALGGVQIAAGASPAGRLFTLAEWALVLRHERQGAQAAGARRGATPAPGDGKELTRQHFNTAVAMTPAHFYQVLQQQLLATVAALEALTQALAARLAAQAPRLAAIEGRLAECYQALQELAGLSWEAAPEPDEDDAAWPGEDGGHGMERRLAQEEDRRQARGRANAGAPRSRDEAYQRLEEAADYLLRTEPHSPVPYLVKRAVGWGGMPLAELLQELMDNESDLKQIYRLLGTHGR